MRKIIQRVQTAFYGEGAKARSLRGGGMTLVSIMGSNVLRLVSNLILTRILFPEAFGLMALVQVFVTGLKMFSDIGIVASIVQNKRGDDPVFLDTAWSLQIVRGFCLWVASIALAYPAAQLYGEPLLIWMLPIVGLTSVIDGFRPTKIATASRHIHLGRITFITLVSRVISVILVVALAWAMESVWALVIGSLIGSALSNTGLHLFLPGRRDRIKIEREACREILSFGKFIFLSTLSSFLIMQGDRAILGLFLTTTELGVYSIGLLLGTLPNLIGKALARNIFFPLYRIRPPAESLENQRKIFKARRLVTAGALALSAALGAAGPWLIGVMYDDRYLLAGPILVLFALRSVPTYVTTGASNVLTANGDSRAYFWVTFATAVLQTASIFLGVHWFGLAGGILGPFFSMFLVYPLLAWQVARFKAWDALGEIGLAAIGIAVHVAICWMHWDIITPLFE